MEVRIFAQKGTTKKAAFICSSEDYPAAMASLAKRHGGNWISVDQLKGSEVLIFDDGLTYKGFDPDQKRYCLAIENNPH